MVLRLDQRAKRSRGLGGPQGTASKTLLLTEIPLSVMVSCLKELEFLLVARQSYMIFESRACT